MASMIHFLSTTNAFIAQLEKIQWPIHIMAAPPRERASEMNMLHRERHPGFTVLDARIASYELAYRMQSEALEVGDLDKEPAHIRESYGINATDPDQSKFARKCLLARRLVQRGVRFVQLYDMHEKDGWVLATMTLPHQKEKSA